MSVRRVIHRSLGRSWSLPRASRIARGALVTTCAVALLVASTPPPPSRADTEAPPASPGLYEATSQRSFADVESWTKVFDDPKRDAWQKPAAVVEALGLGAGMWVADLGAGTGYFSRYLAAAVASTGVVFAVETEPNMVLKLRERAEKERTSNLVPVLASFDDPRLPSGAIDLVLIVDTYHHIDERRSYLARLARTLKPGGRIAIIDWRKEPLPIGPPPDHKIARTQVVEEMESAGFRLHAEPGVLEYQYFLIFTPR